MLSFCCVFALFLFFFIFLLNKKHVQLQWSWKRVCSHYQIRTSDLRLLMSTLNRSCPILDPLLSSPYRGGIFSTLANNCYRQPKFRRTPWPMFRPGGLQSDSSRTSRQMQQSQDKGVGRRGFEPRTPGLSCRLFTKMNYENRYTKLNQIESEIKTRFCFLVHLVCHQK